MPLLAALAVLLVLLAGCALGVVVRRRLLERDVGTVDLSVRLKPHARGGGWVLGIGRFAGDELHWYRMFSLSPRPRRTWQRGALTVVRQRAPRDGESYALPRGTVVMECRTPSGEVALGLDPSAVTGLLAWLEAHPPGATLPAP